MRSYWTVLLLCTAATAYPTETVSSGTRTKIEEITEGEDDVTASITQLPMLGTLSEDKKSTLTYVLGQKKNGALQSPAELLSPDRYEFYTFDDDGQIVKKLMSVKEIQRILANSEKNGADLDEHVAPVEYYQILTVSPDVETLPTATRINPNEPLFSIHDVIASVQNVLRAEIRTKQTQPPPAIVLHPGTLPASVEPSTKPTSHNTATHSSLTEPSTKPNVLNPATLSSLVELSTKPTVHVIKVSSSSQISSSAQKVPSSPAVHKINASIVTTSSQKPLSESTTSSAVPTEKLVVSSSTESSTTKLPSTTVTQARPSSTIKIAEVTTTTTTAKPKPITTTVKKPTQTSSVRPTTQPPVKTTVRSTPSSTAGSSKPLTTTASQKPLVRTTSKPALSTSAVRSTTRAPPTSHTQERRPTTGVPSPQTETTAVPVQSTTILPPAMSLHDAHPGLVTNLALADLESLSEEILATGLIDDYTTTKSDDDFTTEYPSTEYPNTEYPRLNLSESALAQVQIPMNQDLAESVSSVLSQIASEISMSNKMDFDTGLIRSTQETVKEVQMAEDSNTTEGELFELTTLVPARGTTIKENISEEEQTEAITTSSTTTTTSKPFTPQNKPRPFQKDPIDENLIASASNNRIHTTEKSKDKIILTSEKSGSIAAEKGSTTIVNIKDLTQKKEESIEAEVQTEEIPQERKPESDMLAESTTIGNTVELEERRPESDMLAESTTIGNTVALEESSQNTTDLETTTQVQVDGSDVSSKTEISVQVIQEGDTGRIPRPTEAPEPDAATELPLENREGDGPSTIALSTEESLETATEVIVSDSTVSYDKEDVGTTVQDFTESSDSTTTLPTPTEDREDAVDISFVPMVIKAQTLPENKSAIQEALTTTRGTTITEETSTTPIYTTEGVTEELESKVLPEDGIELKHESTAIVTSTVNSQKKTPLVVAKQPAPVELKQNTKPSFGKPQKPVFIKPTKKPQHDGKPKPVIKPKDPVKEENKRPFENHLQSAPSSLELEAAPDENLGLETTTADLDTDVRKFSELCNELAFSLWSSITHNGLSFVRSLVVSPFAVTSLLAMVFLGARGPTSGQMNDVLKLDDMVTFNPHLVFRNVTESLVISRNPGVATAAFVRELYSDKAKGKLLEFYKERAQQFYDGHVEEVNFKTVGETLRRVTNHLVKRQTWGKISDLLRGSTLTPRAPLAAFGANVFQTDCSRASTKDRDGEMYFVVLPSNRLRRLVPVPSVVYRDGFVAGYEPGLDATAVALGYDSTVSTILVLPGQQGLVAPGDSLARLEHHLLGASYRRGHWSRLMRSLLPRPGLELQIPRFSHKSVINATHSLQKMGLRDLFSAERADLTGLNGIANDLHLSDMLQVNLFSTCGEGPIGTQHHSEIYPASPVVKRHQKSADNVFSDSIESLFAVSDFEDPSVVAMPLELRPRQARLPESRIPEPPRLRLDRPFLFFVRHNPTGLILHMGRFNPRLQP